ncbi:MAG: divalent-cation tolerance protein CutA [Hylemonella sp.]|nr:divalent-cation tolerance protein CutA [Hylemonella sp.]
MTSTPTPPYCMVQTALASEAEAAELARGIVQARLGACVQLQAIRSFYVWQGQAHDAPEWLLSIKTRGALYPALEAYIREHHPYETPEIVQLPITAGSAAYLAWLDENTD